jgi:glutathione S-transferase
MLMAERLELMGAPGSPYTRKMIALLRYRHIDYAVRWGGHQNPPAGYPQPKVNLLPTVYFANGAGGLKAEVDSTPIIRRLEAEYRGRSVIPNNPLLAFLCYLLEDFGDEWMTKQMFHYRWAHQADAENAVPLLVYWSVPTLEEDAANQMAAMFAKRQIGRLYVVGSNEVTAETIESSYARLMHILDTLFQKQGYVLGKRPSAADFAIYGQLTQLAIVEPTSAAVASRISPRVRAWLDRVEDLSGLDPESDDWVNLDEIYMCRSSSPMRQQPMPARRVSRPKSTAGPGPSRPFPIRRNAWNGSGSNLSAFRLTTSRPFATCSKPQTAVHC